MTDVWTLIAAVKDSVHHDALQQRQQVVGTAAA